ncbi:MAG: hypothetical protein ABL899_02680 [Nitrospira sp.]
MEKTIRIAIACFAGSFIGGVIAFQIGHVGWPIGALVGGLIAYLGFDFAAVIAAIPVVWESISSWKPDYPVWRFRFRNGLGFLGMAQTLLLFFLPIMEMTKPNTWGFLLSAHAAMFIAGFMSAGKRNQYGQLPEDLMPYKDTNPVGAAYWFCRGLLWLIVRIPRVTLKTRGYLGLLIRTSWKFTVTLFHIIHSELRLLCAVDAALGTTVGYFSGNALIGAVAGAVLGVLNYEIITVRVMQVAGAKSIFR